MSALGISLIAIGIALACAGVLFRPRAPTDPVTDDSPDEFRTILDALGADAPRDEKRDVPDAPAIDSAADSTAGAMAQPALQRRPQLG